MKQLTYIKPGVLRWDEVQEPTLSDSTSALVRPFVVARCDLDAVFLRKNVFRRFQIGRMLQLVDPYIAKWIRPDILKGPFPMGHECIAEVMETGADVRGFSRSDKVVIPFQVSCGTCQVCSNGLTSQCETYGRFDMYSGIGKHATRGGMLSEVVLVPNAQHMLIPVPPTLDPLNIASASDNLPDAWSRVAPELLDNPGKDVLVIGGSTRSVALYCVAFAVAMGAARVDYLDRNPGRRKIASSLGGNAISSDLATVDHQYDLVVNGTNRPSAVADSIRCLKPGGVCTSMNIYFDKSIPIPFFQLYAKNLTLKSGLANPMADIPSMLSFIENRQVNIGAVNTRIASWDQASNALIEDTTKVIIRRNPIYA